MPTLRNFLEHCQDFLNRFESRTPTNRETVLYIQSYSVHVYPWSKAESDAQLRCPAMHNYDHIATTF